MYRRGFTLIELLVVIAIVAVLAVVVVLVLNPAQLLMQARDSNRFSDLASINSAMGYYLADQTGGTIGTASTTYVSFADSTATSTAGDQCQALGMPAVGSSTWHCAASSTWRKSDSTGWIPVALSNVSYGTPLAQLPADPINVTSSNLFYTYQMSGNQYMATAVMESSKYKSQLALQPMVSGYPEVAAVGNNLTISGLWSSSGLVGYWPLNEGSGSSTIDQSGNANVGAWSGTAVNGSYYTSGKIGSYAGNFNGASTYVNIASSTSLNVGPSNAITVAAWVNWAADVGAYDSIITKDNSVSAPAGSYTLLLKSNQTLAFYLVASPANYINVDGGGNTVSFGAWHHIVGTWDGTTIKTYIDGSLNQSAVVAKTFSGISPLAFNIGATSSTLRLFNGQINDARVYNRALSAAEVQALYNAEK